MNIKISKIIIAVFFSIIIFSCKENFDKKSYAQQKQTIAQKEESNPLEFLKVKGADKKNIFGTTVIRGTITNAATVCPYSNARIRILSFKNGVQAEEHEDVVEGPINPGAEKEFKIKYHLPKGTDSIAFFLMSAHPVESSMER